MRLCSKKRKELETQFPSSQSSLANEDISKREKVKIIPSAAAKNHQISLPKKYIWMIRNQSKTVEGRIFKGFVNNLKVGDGIRFFYHQNQMDDVKCKITKIEKYPSFEKMLQSCGYSTCVPDVSGLSEAVEAYHRIPGYLTLAKTYGVAAIHLQLVDVKK